MCMPHVFEEYVSSKANNNAIWSIEVSMKICFWSIRGVFLTVFATQEKVVRELIPKTTPRNGSKTTMSQHLKYISFTHAQVDQKGLSKLRKRVGKMDSPVILWYSKFKSIIENNENLNVLK